MQVSSATLLPPAPPSAGVIPVHFSRQAKNCTTSLAETETQTMDPAHRAAGSTEPSGNTRSITGDENDADPTPRELARRLHGQEADLRWLVDRLTPVIQMRVARLLTRQAHSRKRNLAQEVEDQTQEVFMSLFENDAKVLRSWDPARGLSLDSFVALVAERRVYSVLRSARRNPWTEEPRPVQEIDRSSNEVSPDRRAVSRQQLSWLLQRLQSQLSPLGRRMFELLFVREAPLDEVEQMTGLSPDAIYAWRSRLRRLAVRLRQQARR